MESALGSKQESLNKRIRETITSLSDEQLSDMRRASDKNYTPFARKVVEEELTRRRKIVAAKDASENNASLAGNREEVARGTDEINRPSGGSRLSLAGASH